MAELADAHGSGPCDSNIMRVQVPSSARRLKSKGLSLFCLVESSDGTSHHQFARSVQYASRSSLPSVPFTAIPSPIKLQTWIVASGKPFESCKHSHRQPSAASASSPPTHSAGEAPAHTFRHYESTHFSLSNQHPAADTPQTQKPSRQITPSGRFSLISLTIKPVLFLLTQQALQSPLRR